MVTPQETLDRYEAERVPQPEWTAADQEQLQRDHPPPFKAIVINRQSGKVVGVVPWATRPRAQRARPSRPGRTRTIRRQSHVARRSNRTRGPDEQEGELELPEAPAEAVEPPRHKSDLLAARVYVWRELLRLVDLAADGTARRHHEAVADLAWDRSREGRQP